MLVQTHKAIGQLHKEIRSLEAGVDSVNELIKEKQIAIANLEELINEEQRKIIAAAELPVNEGMGAEDAIYNNIPDEEEVDVGMAGVAYWNMIDALRQNVNDIINNPNATAEGVLAHVEHLKLQVDSCQVEFEEKYMK